MPTMGSSQRVERRSELSRPSFARRHVENALTQKLRQMSSTGWSQINFELDLFSTSNPSQDETSRTRQKVELGGRSAAIELLEQSHARVYLHHVRNTVLAQRNGAGRLRGLSGGAPVRTSSGPGLDDARQDAWGWQTLAVSPQERVQHL